MGLTWTKVADLPDRTDVGAIRASPDGYGLIGVELSGEDGGAIQKLRGSRAAILRATRHGVVPMYEGLGWIVAIDGAGPVWFAVQATLKRSGSCSDYRLLRSIDRGMQWEDRGVIDARSIKSVLAIDENTAWVHGATVLAATTNGGGGWTPVDLPGDRDPTRERLRRDGATIALACDGAVHTSTDGGATFRTLPFPGAAAYDVADGRVLLTSDDGDMTIAPMGTDEPAIAIPKKERLGLRLVAEGWTLRVLSRGADPSLGARMMLHGSDDAGRSWSHTSLAVSPRCDIAGTDFGIGADNGGGIHLGPVLDS